jgi:hypothetical protein
MNTDAKTKQLEKECIGHFFELDGNISDFIMRFYNDDPDILINNIENGLPLETGSPLLDALHEDLAGAEDTVEKLTTLLCRLAGHVDEEGEGIIESELGRDHLIRYKRLHDIPVTGSEVDYLLARVKNVTA